jgi:hypothetical protein
MHTLRKPTTTPTKVALYLEMELINQKKCPFNRGILISSSLLLIKLIITVAEH